MKKPLLALTMIGAFAGASMAQTLVTNQPTNKKVILEDFSGIYCGFCPDGHVVADDMVAAKVFKHLQQGKYPTRIEHAHHLVWCSRWICQRPQQIEDSADTNFFSRSDDMLHCSLAV